MKNNNEMKNENSDTIAAMGIGAMIVFIALILVAAVASAVIIQTAEKLQQNAQATGEGTKDAMASKVSIINTIVSDAAGTEVTITFELAPGSEQVDPTNVFWIAACNGGPDSGTFVGLVNLDPVGAPAAISPGEIYTQALVIANCFGLDTQLGIQAGGAGFTYEAFSSGAWVNGDVLV
jgi:flagellin FlaB